jgi:hypothetical protein
MGTGEFHSTRPIRVNAGQPEEPCNMGDFFPFIFFFAIENKQKTSSYLAVSPWPKVKLRPLFCFLSGSVEPIRVLHQGWMVCV